MWRSLVARMNGVHEAASSNLVAPILKAGNKSGFFAVSKYNPHFQTALPTTLFSDTTILAVTDSFVKPLSVFPCSMHVLQVSSGASAPSCHVCRCHLRPVARDKCRFRLTARDKSPLHLAARIMKETLGFLQNPRAFFSCSLFSERQITSG